MSIIYVPFTKINEPHKYTIDILSYIVYVIAFFSVLGIAFSNHVTTKSASSINCVVHTNTQVYVCTHTSSIRKTSVV